jgi:hypothetical protein
MPVVITAVSFTVKDATGAPVSADEAISGIVLADTGNVYLDSVFVPAQQVIYYELSRPVTLTAGETRDVYLTVDITGDTFTAAENFSIGIETAGHIIARDYNSDGVIPGADTEKSPAIKCGSGQYNAFFCKHGPGRRGSDEHDFD